MEDLSSLRSKRGTLKGILTRNDNFVNDEVGLAAATKAMLEIRRDKTINADNGETLTFRDFAQRVVDVALSLTRLGVKRGDVVSICSEKRIEFLPTLIGIVCAGAAFAPADVTCGKATMLHRVNIAKPRVMFCSPAGWEKHKDTLQSIDSIETFIIFGDETQNLTHVMSYRDFLTETGSVEEFQAASVEGWKDWSIILYSSGTTGLPKGIPHTHLGFLSMLTNMVKDWKYEGSIMLNTREWYYTYGMTMSLGMLRAGATIVYSPRNQIEDFFTAIEKYKVTVMQLAPSTITEMVKCPLPKEDLSSLKFMISASTPASMDLIRAAKARFQSLQDVFQVYGMSESGTVCSEEYSPQGIRDGSVGTPPPGSVVKVVDPDTGKVQGPMERGEICIKSPTVTLGYIGDGTPDCFDEEGFLKTGDIGYYDQDRCFYIVTRIKELIKFNSFQVAPAELEAVLEAHPAVREAGVVGAPHERFLEAPLAFVALQPGAAVTEDELIAYVDTQVSSRMRLEGGLRFVEKLPRGAGDKLDRKTLKSWI